MTTAETLLWLARIWLIVGGVTAAAFLTIGIDRIDEDAQGTYAFRPLLLPGILLLWPLVLWRWYVLETGRDDPDARFKPVRTAHGAMAVTLCIVILGTVLFALSSRQNWPAEFEPVQLSAPDQTPSGEVSE
ncbi:MAG: hypothetical protein GJ676_13810 [Rhodobacteraceae bacterium]|nr:hypothetical protein [Paracoccaceae bacterium]